MSINCGCCGMLLTHIDEACPNCLPSMAERPPPYVKYSTSAPCIRCEKLTAELADLEKALMEAIHGNLEINEHKDTKAERDRLNQQVGQLEEWLVEAFNNNDTERTAKEKAEAELAKTQRILEIERSSSHSFCPDCRDKVKLEPCLRCQKQRAEAERDRHEQTALWWARHAEKKDEIIKNAQAERDYLRAERDYFRGAFNGMSEHAGMLREERKNSLTDFENFADKLQGMTAHRNQLREALDGLTTVAETLIQERAINGSLAIQGWCKRARKALARKDGE